jgi:hypothetical protein
MVDIRKTGNIHDIIINQCDNQSDIHRFQKLFHPSWHLEDKAIYRLLEFRRKMLLALSDSFPSQNASHRNVYFLFIGWRLMSQDIADSSKNSCQQQAIQS